MNTVQPHRPSPWVWWVAEAYNCTITSLLSKSRSRDTVEARWVAMRLMEQDGLTVTQIARNLGGMHHSTIIHGLRKAAETRSIRETAEQIRDTYERYLEWHDDSASTAGNERFTAVPGASDASGSTGSMAAQDPLA